jgi:hypothetical protein
MATSISKLAIMLTADTTGLNTGLTRAQAAIKGFGMKMNANGAGNFLGMFARGTAGIAAAGIAIAGVYKFLRLGITAGAQFEQAMTTSTNTLIGRWDALKLSVGGFAAMLTGPFRDAMTGSLEGLADMFDSVTRFFGGKTGAEMAKLVEARKKHLDLLKQEKEVQEKAAKAAHEAHERMVQSMRDRGAAITEALRNPVEVFADTMNELRELAGQGFIDPDTFARGTAKARADLVAATKLAKEFKSQTNFSVGAVERFSSAGFSAIQSGRAELIKIIEAEKEQLAEEKRQTKLLEEGNELARTRKPVVFKRSNL